MKHFQKMQYLFMAFYPLMRLFGAGNTLSEVGRAMIAVSKSGYEKHTIDGRDIINLAKEE